MAPEVSDGDAVCIFIEKQFGYAENLVSSHQIFAGDRSLLNVLDEARVYRLQKPGVELVYVVTSDNRILISRFEMKGDILSRQVENEKNLAEQLHVPLPFPPALELSCGMDQLQIITDDGKLRSLTVIGLID